MEKKEVWDLEFKTAKEIYENKIKNKRKKEV